MSPRGIIEDPVRNTREHLLERAKTLSEESLEALRKQAKEVIEERRDKDDRDIKKQHWVE